ncbi:calcium-binding protein, partial [Cyanobium gracile UHCC 0281]
AGAPASPSQELPPAAAGSLAAGSSSQPLAVAAARLEATRPTASPPVTDMDAGRETAAATTTTTTTTMAMAAEPEIPSLRVVLRSNEGIVSRSVEGAASTSFRNELGAITDAVIDLRNVATPLVEVSSDRRLNLLSLSVLNDADLTMESRNTGLNQARLLFGPEANDIRLQVSDVIDLALLAGGTARGQILESLIGMLDSQLQDIGGGGSLELSSLARFQLRAPTAPEHRQLGIDLLSQAMQNSSILLGDGDDRVTISSGFQDLEGSGPGLILDIPSPQTGQDDASLQLRARALGLVDSLLDVGGGDDLVSISVRLEGPDGREGELQRIALMQSEVLLGDGDDQLTVEGAVIDSRLSLGSGSNELLVNGSVASSTVALAPDSSNAIRLADGDDGLTLTLASGERAAVTLDTAAGDDLILLPAAALSGSVDGGDGVDTLRNVADAETSEELHPDDRGADPLPVRLDGPGEGSIGSLNFRGLENLALGDGDAVVSMGARGVLDGVLEAGNGVDGLDYGAWQESVSVDLRQGEASGILGGISGFEAVRGGAGDDRLVAAADTLRLEGGDGDDTFELDLSARPPAGTAAAADLVVSGGQGRDRFVLAGLEAIRAMAAGSKVVLPVLADLELRPSTTADGIGLTDQVSLRLVGVLPGAAGNVIDLTPSGLDGIGQARLLPIAPLDQLVAGMDARSTGIDQLAIATGELGSRLVLLGSDRSVTALAQLPGLQSAGLPASGEAMAVA